MQTEKEILEKKLRPKQRIWCHEYIIDWNATRAAIKAGYSVKTASDIGYANTKKADLKAYISLIKDDIEAEAGISKLRQVRRLMNMAYSTIADMHDTWIGRKAFEELAPEQKECIESIETRITKSKEGIYSEEVETEQVKIKLYSALEAVKELNKMLGHYTPEEKNITITPTKVKWGDSELEV